MKRKRFWKAAKNTAAVSCLGVCLWCGAASLKSWGEKPDVPLFTVAGQETGAPRAVTVAPRPELLLFTEELPPEHQPLAPDDGIVPFHDDLLPGIFATPDPGRAHGPVEEITISGGQQVADFFVRDTSDSGTDLLEELSQPPAVSLKGDGSVEILIYHTHTSEAYSVGYSGFYYTDMETRTGNRDRSVVAAGEALKAALEARGFGVVHDTTVNDELFNGSYSRSWETIQRNLEEHPGIQVTIDVHRDSMTTQEGVKYKPTALIDGRRAAQIMFLAGCDADGGWGDFPDWRDNLRLILRAQQKATELWPDLVRPLDFSDCKYNMNATPGSMLVEIGTEVNTVSEARYAAQLLGEALAEVFTELKGP